MRKRALPVAVTEGPDARDIRAQFVVHDDITVVIHSNAGLLQAEISGIRLPPYREQHMCPTHLVVALCAIHSRHHFVATLGKADTVRIQPELDAFALENLLNTL